MEPKNEMQRLKKLIGKWSLTGRTLQSKKDDILGTASFEWILDGHFILHKGTMEVPGMKIESWSIIGYDPETDNFSEMIYMNLGHTPTKYFWNISENEVFHWSEGAKYSGFFKENGKVLEGGWRAVGDKSTFKSPFDATMTKVD